MNTSGNEPLNYIYGEESLRFHLAVTRKSNKIIKVIGKPGIGKTEIFKQVAAWGADVLPTDVTDTDISTECKRRGIKNAEDWKPEVHSLYVSHHDDIEFIMPWINPESGAYELVPTPLLTRMSMGCYQIFDECTMEGMQRAMLQMCSGTRISYNGWVGPRGVTRVMLGNTAESGNFSYVDNPVLGNRLSQYEWEPIHDEWIANFAQPHRLHPLIIAAVKMEGQDFFLDYEATRNRNTTPRSLHDASDRMLAAEAWTGGTLDDGRRMEVLAGSLPDEAALKIQALFTLHDKLVPFSAIVNQPDTAPIPDNPAALFMVCANVARRTCPETWSQVMGWVIRLPLELQGSIVEPVIKAHPVLTSTDEFQSYTIRTAPLVV